MKEYTPMRLPMNSFDFDISNQYSNEFSKEWLDDFLNFEQWAFIHGYDPTAPKLQCTIDRIDNSKGYGPDNCRWVDIATQNRNRRNTKREVNE